MTEVCMKCRKGISQASPFDGAHDKSHTTEEPDDAKAARPVLKPSQRGRPRWLRQRQGFLRVRLSYPTMQWPKEGAHWLLQTRVRTLNGELGAIFKRWYPDMDIEAQEMPAAA